MLQQKDSNNMHLGRAVHGEQNKSKGWPVPEWAAVAFFAVDMKNVLSAQDDISLGCKYCILSSKANQGRVSHHTSLQLVFQLCLQSKTALCGPEPRMGVEVVGCQLHLLQLLPFQAFASLTGSARLPPGSF